MITASGTVVVVAARSDRLAAMLVRRLCEKSSRVVVCEPRDLVDLPVVLDSARFEVDGVQPSAVVWRVTPDMPLSASVAAPDQVFASAEVVSAWLHGLNLPTVYAINRYPAAVWYGGLHWSTWHTWLRARGVPVSALHLGAGAADGKRRWMPFLLAATAPIPDAVAATALAIATSAAEPAVSVLAVAGRLLDPTPSIKMQAAAATLNESGVILARVTFDCDDHVLSVDSTPDFDEDEQLATVVSRVAETIHARLCAR